MKRVALLAVIAACPRSDNKPIEPPAKGHPLAADDAALELPPAPPLPAIPKGLPAIDLPATVTPEAVALGELLFFDPRLSSTGKLACASCHDPDHGYAGGMDQTATGEPNLRRTPALVDLAWQRAYGWDGRYHTLDDLLTVHVRGQLGNPVDAAAKRLGDIAGYRAHLARVGGAPEDAIVHALGAYVLTRYEGDSPWDRVEATAHAPKAGGTPDPIVAGYLLFAGKARCASCHPPPLYTDLGYHAVIAPPVADKGRGLVDPTADGAFETPTLRGAAARRHFFHAGKTDALEATLHAAPDHAFALSPVDEQVLLGFVRALTAPATPHPRPALP